MTDIVHAMSIESPRTKIATFPSICPGCDLPIEPEMAITECEFGWIHEGCPVKAPAPKVILEAGKRSDCPTCGGIIDPPEKIMPMRSGAWAHLVCPERPRFRQHATDRPPRGMSMRIIEHYTGEIYGDR